MIRRIRHIYSTKTDPYWNLGLEEYLLNQVQPGECIFYLWQNQHTVVIGRNQNSWKECKVEQLEADGGRLARRLSGGGAVYHDLGNLNFTFLIREEDYDVDRQLEVILKAIRSWGINVEKSGRNDITVDGRKCSGNAFYSSGGHSYHHGTLLVNVEMEKLSHYLNVSAEKIRSKGVESVKARVINLQELAPEMTIEGMQNALLEAFEEVYQLPSTEMQLADLNVEAVDELNDQMSSWQWKHGRKIPFSVSMERRFPWGDISLQFHIKEGMIEEVNAYSDGMDIAFVGLLPTLWEGCPFQKGELRSAIESAPKENELIKTIATDILQLLEDELK